MNRALSLTILMVLAAGAARAQSGPGDDAVQAPPDLPGVISWIQDRLIGRKSMDKAYAYTTTQVKIDCAAIDITDNVKDGRQYTPPYDEHWLIPVQSIRPRYDFAGLGSFEFSCVKGACITLTLSGGSSALAAYDVQMSPPTAARRLAEAVTRLQALCPGKPAA